MSWSRFAADSDVYTFPCVSGAYECCGCHLTGGFRTRDVAAFVTHLQAHRDAGHTVPDYTEGAVLAWADEYPAGWGEDRVAGYSYVAGRYVGVVRTGNGVALFRCGHRHARSDLARTCADAAIERSS